MEPKLSIELVPSSSWYSNVRSNVSPREWDVLRKHCYAKANYICEICAGKGKKWPVECHEVWEYDEENHIQKLARMIALCPMCHKTKHIGHSINIGLGMAVLKHLCKVNSWPEEKASMYIQCSMVVWQDRSQHKWELDLKYLDKLQLV